MGASCDPDYTVIGMQNGEQIVNMLRLVALCISLSVLHPWLNPARRQHMRIFFLHWTSGVAYVLSQFVMSVMVLNCWSSRRTAGPFIFLFKFVELTAVNLWAISSISIAIVITRIVQAFSHLRRVSSVVGSVQTVWRCTALAIALSCCSAPFWNDVRVTGAYFWVTNSGNARFARWISLSFLTTQAVAGFLMALILIFNVTGPRRASLIVCCRTSKRVKIYFVLTILGTCVYLYNGAVLFVDEFAVFRVGKNEMVMIGWCSKYMHVIADTFVLFSAFQAIDKRSVAVEATGPRAQPSAGRSSSDHSRMTVPGPSWLCDSLPRTASGTHNTTGEIRSPASSASPGSFSSPKIAAEKNCDRDEGNGSQSSPLPQRSAFGRLVAGVTGRSSKSAASWISGNGDSARDIRAAAVVGVADGGGGSGGGGGGHDGLTSSHDSAGNSKNISIISINSSSNVNSNSNSHIGSNINSNSNSHSSGNTNSNSNTHASSNINNNISSNSTSRSSGNMNSNSNSHSGGNINSNSNSHHSNSNNTDHTNTHNTNNTNVSHTNTNNSNDNKNTTRNRRLNIFNFSETASKGSSRGNTAVGTAIGNSSNRPEFLPCSLAPTATPFATGGGSGATSSGRLTVRAGPPHGEEDVEAGWVNATEVSTV